MVDRIKCFDKVYEDHVRFEVVFSSELDDGLKGEDGVGASLALEAIALFLHAIISNVGVHVVYNDCGENCTRYIEEIDGAPVVGVGCSSL